MRPHLGAVLCLGLLQLSGGTAKQCVVIPTLTSTAEQFAKLKAATRSVVNAGGTLVLVDDGSPFDLSPLAAQDSVVLVRHAANYGPGAARNTGARVAMQLFSSAAFEDVEFCVRSAKAGVVAKYAEDALVLHDYEESLTSFSKQFFRCKRT